ncbi:MAG: hypothetical protein ACPG51_20370 [Thiolinea sp.]
MSTDNATEHLVRIAELETENRLLKEQIQALKEQQQLDRDQIKNLTSNQSNKKALDKKWW